MDSDSDYVDDITECCYYGSDPYTYNPDFIPPKDNTTIPLSITKLTILSIFVQSCILVIFNRRKKKKLFG